MPRKGWWKPYISGAVGAGLGLAQAAAGAASGNPIGLAGGLSAAYAGAKKAYALHESIREKYNIPWLGKFKNSHGPGVMTKEHYLRSRPKMGGKHIGGRTRPKPYESTKRPEGVPMIKNTKKPTGASTPRMGKKRKSKK